MKLFFHNWPRELAGAWIFYTVFPKLPWIKPKFERIARFAPWIGLFIGCLQSGIWLFLSHWGWPHQALAPIVIAIGIGLTGGLHHDGLIDTADGIAAGRKKMLLAMDDSRVGASGLQVLLLVVLIQISALIKLHSFSPLAMPIAAFWGRCAPLWAINNFSYLRKENGSAGFHHRYSQGWSEAIPALFAIISIFFTCLLSPYQLNFRLIFFAVTSIGIFPTLLVPYWLGSYLKGHSGDSYGASTVLVETIMLLLFALLV